MCIALVLAFRVGLLDSANGEQAVLPDLLSSQNHVGCYSTTSLLKRPSFKDLEVCVSNCTESLTQSDDVTPCTHSCNASFTNLVGVQFSQAIRSPLFFCFCGNEAKLRLLEKVTNCQCCPHTTDRFCGGEKAISLYNISDYSITTLHSIPEAVKTSTIVPRQTHKYTWHSTYDIQTDVEATTSVEPNLEPITENEELETDQESITDVNNDLDVTSYDQYDVELTLETSTSHATTSPRSTTYMTTGQESESTSHVITSPRSTTYMTTGQDSDRNIDNIEPIDDPHADSDFYDDNYYSDENGRNNNPPESYSDDETDLEVTTETAFQLQSSQDKPWELWVIVVLSGLSILTVGAVIILVSFLRTRLHGRESYA